MQTLNNPLAVDTIIASEKPAKLWMPKRVLFTPDALDEPFGKQIYERVNKYALPIEILKNNRINGLRGET